MDLLFLGTGAADWKPEDWAREPHGRYLTAAVLSGQYLIDCGPTLPDAAAFAGFDLTRVRGVFVTHLHRDHFDREVARRLADGGAVFYSSPENAERLAEMGLPATALPVGEEQTVGGLAVTPIAANHVVAYLTPNRPVHYVFKSEGKTLFWGCDGCWLTCESWHLFRRFRYDAVILDGTFGDEKGHEYCFEHNTLRTIEEFSYVLRGQDLLAPGARVFINHMSKNMHTDHDALVRRVAPFGIEVARDGLRISV
ncbi:MAG: MBL fold metallo-hydrolase [Clostridia bacterium]|nr:MBL fold metallo-hydrolase [Clostridia bacterium]